MSETWCDLLNSMLMGSCMEVSDQLELMGSKSVGHTHPSSAELLAIKEAFESFDVSVHVVIVNLVVESDCLNKIRLVTREFNCVADALIKAGIK
ncbi:hypothetical protein V6N13_094598 [Hibiscus sabdariffa]|uniref:RNase H type-1 domain-containing protein n=1 Tax=Hibiscus sabdariffa TaxID=183260 RepID=A0ABR2PPR0_9ROSI